VNDFLASRWSEVVHRLAIGIEPRDAARGARVASALELRVERPVGVRDVSLLRHASGRWSLRYVPRLPANVDVLIDDPRRRFVPRRLRLPIVPEADVRAAERLGGHLPPPDRTWAPALYPGAAYAVGAAATGLRGTAERAGVPVRWAGVEAVVRGTTRVVGRAHGDDRGEFLLLVAPDPAAPAELPDAVRLTITVRGAKPAPVPPADASDDLWGLPLENVAPPGPISAGVQLPPGYVPGFTASRDVDLVPGRIRAAVEPFVLA
jgi:hypothetical protein